MARWTAADMRDLTGKTVVVTGASSGIGAAAAAAFAAKGADVVLAVRNAAKGETVRDAILRRHPSAEVLVASIDLADLASIRAFADRMVHALPQVDILLNNAGLGMQRARAISTDGFERQFATNHLGPFALTGLLLPALLKAPAPRVVAISSLAHRGGAIDFDDLQGERRYGGLKAYSQSKLANLLFTAELNRRATAVGARLVAVAAHPGFAATGFIQAIGLPTPLTAAMQVGAKVVAQTAERGALPGLYAATAPDVAAGAYIGPGGPGEMRGSPAPATLSTRSRDATLAARLWQVSETLTGVDYRRLDPRFGAV